MMIVYDTTSFDVITVVAGSDADVLAQLNAGKPAGSLVFTITDDPTILAAPPSHVTADGITAELKKTISLSWSANPIDLKDSPTLSVQLKEPNGVTNLNEVHTVTLTSSFGVLADPTLTTNGSGFASTTYKPNKGNGAFVTATAPRFVSNGINITISTPTSPANQNWLESNDVKLGAITGPKIADGAVTAAKMGGDVSSPPTMRTGFFAQLVRDINSIVVDATHVFINGHAGPGATNPRVKKLEKVGGQVVGTTSYTPAAGTALTNGTDGIADDGVDLWVAAGGDLLQINKGTMVITNQFAIDATGGNLQFIVDDTTHILSLLRGGTSGDADKLVRINKGTGAIDASWDAFADFSLPPADIRYAFLLGGDLYLLLDPTGSNYFFGNAGLGGAFNASTAAFAATLENAIATDGSTVWVGGTNGIWVDYSALPGPSLPAGGFVQLDSSVVGEVFSIVWSGTDETMWAITSAPGGGAPQYLREIFPVAKYDVGGNQMTWNIEQGRVFDISTYPNIGTPSLIVPIDVKADANYLYTGNTQVQAAGVPKDTISKLRYKD